MLCQFITEEAAWSCVLGENDDVAEVAARVAAKEASSVEDTGKPPRQPRRDAAGVDQAALRFCERFLELLIDLLSQLPTRKFLHALLVERHVVVKAKRSLLYQSNAGSLFRQLLDQFEFYIAFPVDNHTGEALSVRPLCT